MRHVVSLALHKGRKIRALLWALPGPPLSSDSVCFIYWVGLFSFLLVLQQVDGNIFTPAEGVMVYIPYIPYELQVDHPALKVLEYGAELNLDFFLSCRTLIIQLFHSSFLQYSAILADFCQLSSMANLLGAACIVTPATFLHFRYITDIRALSTSRCLMQVSLGCWNNDSTKCFDLP